MKKTNVYSLTEERKKERVKLFKFFYHDNIHCISLIVRKQWIRKLIVYSLTLVFCWSKLWLERYKWILWICLLVSNIKIFIWYRYTCQIIYFSLLFITFYFKRKFPNYKCIYLLRIFILVWLHSIVELQKLTRNWLR